MRHVHLAVKVKEAMPLYGQIGRWCGLLKLNKHGNFRVPFRQIDKVYWTKTFRTHQNIHTSANRNQEFIHRYKQV